MPIDYRSIVEWVKNVFAFTRLMEIMSTRIICVECTAYSITIIIIISETIFHFGQFHIHVRRHPVITTDVYMCNCAYAYKWNHAFGNTRLVSYFYALTLHIASANNSINFQIIVQIVIQLGYSTTCRMAILIKIMPVEVNA